MSVRLRELYLPLDHVWDDVRLAAARRLGVGPEDLARCEPVRRAVDARRKGRVSFVYTVSVDLEDPAREADLAGRVPHGHAFIEAPPSAPAPLERGTEELLGPVVVIGAGPAGAFAALRLAEAGYSPVVIERGPAVEDREAGVPGSARPGTVSCEGTVVFGEGGAGTYSDGKLTHRSGSDEAASVLDVLIECGADPDILIDARPHVGSDVLPGVVANLRRRVETAGGSFRFRTRATGFAVEKGLLAGLVIEGASGREEVRPGAVVLAPGLSARDTWRELLAAGVALECRPTLVGVRVEHPQELVDRAQYGEAAGHPRLGPAEYLLKHPGRGRLRPVHSFCMCPGGRVIPVATVPGMLSTNGMSRRERGSGFANAALVCPVGPADYGGAGPLSGVEFLERLEREAFAAGGGDYSLPCQRLADLVTGHESRELPPGPAGTRRTPADVASLLPRVVVDSIRAAVKHFNRRIRGFLSTGAAVYGSELRAGSPVRIRRDEGGSSVSAGNLYPAGEGAGYAGGIVSSAVDGLRQAARVVRRFAPVR